MNWKEFLKPQKKKLTLFIIIIVISCIFGFFYMPLIGGFVVYRNVFLIPFGSQELKCNGGCSVPQECPEEMVLCPIRNIIDYLLNEPHYFVITVIYWYLLSCIIIWIYDKVKKK